MVLVFIVLFAALVLLMLKHKEKLQLLARGEFESVFPSLFGRRAAQDGKGFYSRVEDTSGYDPYANADRYDPSISPTNSSKGSLTKRKDVQLTSTGSTQFAEDNFTL